jgi:hypothetical protein
MRAGWFLAIAAACSPGCGRRNFDPDADTDGVLPSDTALDANYAFVTSAIAGGGSLGGLGSGDAICAMAAADAGLPGTYVAWLSTASVNAISRLAGSRGWIRPDGRVIADRPTELTTTGPRVPIAVTEHGVDLRGVGPAGVLTGTDASGAATMFHCQGWLVPDAATMTAGHLAGGTVYFTESTLSATCNGSGRLYCFGTGKVVTLAPPPPAPPLAFVTRSAWNPASGIAAADALCASEAAAAGLSGGFLAALAPTGATTASRFSDPNAFYRRPDGVELGRVLSGQLAVGFLNRYADGTFAPTNRAWTGGPPNLAAGDPSNCASWTSSAPSSQIGVPAMADGEMFGGNAESCATSLPVYCLQN